jgi:putative CocE/NonD family hydrolase
MRARAPRFTYSAVLLLGAFLLGLPQAGFGAEDLNQEWFREHYVKREAMVPMRDGIRLRTTVYTPKDSLTNLPVLLTRTPYGIRPYGSSAYPDPRGNVETLAKDRFIFVFQDVRGRNGSEGEFVHVRPYLRSKAGPADIDESTDAWDTIDWIVRNVARNNGRVGMLGISYPGFYTSMGMIDSHPALKAASPQAPIADWFIGDDFHHNGAFFLPHAFNFLSSFGQTLEEPIRERPRPFDHKTPDGYDFFLRMGPLSQAEAKHFKGKIQFWPVFAEHPTYDAFWQARNIRPNLRNIRCAVMTVGGWFDAEDLFGALETYRAVERQNDGVINMIVMGPWAHGDWSHGSGRRLGDLDFTSDTGEYFRNEVLLRFFRHFLKDDARFGLPEALMFETGINQWRRFDRWPPAGSTNATFYLQPDGGLGRQRPEGGADAFDEFLSDPSRPVPFIPGTAIGMTRDYMTGDQRFAARRPDVLVYATEPLEEDLTIAGPIEVSLYVSTTGTDADWIVKLIDVYDPDYPDPDPDPAGVRMGGYQQLVRGEPMRGRFRNSFERPEPFTPDQTEKVSWVMPDVLHTFRRGHRVMVQVQSTWFPLVDRNPQSYVGNIWNAKPEDFRVATHRVYRGGGPASQISFRILPPERPPAPLE